MPENDEIHQGGAMTKQRSERIRESGLSRVNAWRGDWVLFTEEALGVTLDTEQREILRSVQHNRRTSVVSGTARGKDFVAACAALAFLYLTPRWQRNSRGEIELAENTKVALTAPTDRQVKNIMMPEIARLYNKARTRGVMLPGRLNAYDIRTENEEWFLTGFKADENNHEAWSGFHAVHTMFVVTEATGISDDTFDAIEGNLQGDSRILIVFNPNTSAGYAARSQRGDRWRCFRLNSLAAPNVRERREVIPGQVNYEWVLDKLETWCTPISAGEVLPEMDDFQFEGQWYRPEDLFRKKVLGQFPKVSDDALIPRQWLELAHERWREQQEGASAPRDNRGGSQQPLVIGVDVAGMGRDSSVLCERKGPRVEPLWCHNSGGRADHMQLAGQVRNLLRERRGKEGAEVFISIDTIGEGAGTYSRLLELTEQPECIISCKYSAAAREANGRPLSDITGQYQFLNMRAYLFWAVRDWLNPANDTGAMLPPDARLDEEAAEIRWGVRSSGSIYIEPKEDIKQRLGRSPDRFDALANTFYPLPRRRNAVNLERLASMIGR